MNSAARADSATRGSPDTELNELQRQTGQPWSSRLNWLLDKPGGSSLGMRWYQAAVLVFAGVAVGVLRLTPVFGPPSNALEWVIGFAGAALIPVGLLRAWSAVRLRRVQSEAGLTSE